MAATTLYCSRQDVLDRLSEAGAQYCTDDTLQGLTKGETIDDAILAVGALWIDPAVVRFFTAPLSQSDASRNETLRRYAIVLAVEYLIGRRPGGVPESVSVQADNIREQLRMIAAGKMRVPGLTYPGDGFVEEQRAIGRPVVGNPRRSWRR